MKFRNKIYPAFLFPFSIFSHVAAKMMTEETKLKNKTMNYSSRQEGCLKGICLISPRKHMVLVLRGVSWMRF